MTPNKLEQQLSNKTGNSWIFEKTIVYDPKPKSKKFSKIYFLNCVECNTLFVHRNKARKKYCSVGCRNKNSYNRHKAYYEAIRAKKRVTYNHTCIICKKSFKTNRKDSKYCSDTCRSIRPKRTKERVCLACNKVYIGEGYKYCSTECKKPSKPSKLCKICKVSLSSNSKTYCSSCKPKYYTPTQPTKLTCTTCGDTFLSKRKDKKYCRKACDMSRKSYKRARKRRKIQAKLPSVRWVDIEEIYKNTPKGYHVDHIIPLNHEKVCGLHVPWNLQYLSKDDNIKKSNSFDGTSENNSWRK